MNTAALEQARFNMIEQQIRPWDVLDPVVLQLLSDVHREDFVPAQHKSLAFVDMMIPLTNNSADSEAALRQGQVMLEPKVEARMLQQLNLTGKEKVLEVGAGSGYMAALLARRAQRVITLEIDGALAAVARDNLQAAGIHNVEVRNADGARDLSVDGPFDVIVLSGSVAMVPESLLGLLKTGGRLGAIVGDDPVMRATFVTRHGATDFRTIQPWDTLAPRLLNFPEPSAFVF